MLSYTIAYPFCFIHLLIHQLLVCDDICVREHRGFNCLVFQLPLPYCICRDSAVPRECKEKVFSRKAQVFSLNILYCTRIAALVSKQGNHVFHHTEDRYMDILGLLRR